MKKVWIINHYATNTFFDQGGRHYCFAKYLLINGYKPTIFCANTIHNSYKKINIEGRTYKIDKVDSIPYVFVKTSQYLGNGFSRIRNMCEFAWNVTSVAKKIADENGTPDVILASSVHPLTLLAGIFLAKRYKIPCVCEVRDLWPETLVAYGKIKQNSLVAKLLYSGEKWIYSKASKIIFTMEGGRDYLLEKGWDKDIDLNKVYHVNNGVELEKFNFNKKNFVTDDTDLSDQSSFKIVYTGSIRRVNNLKIILEVAKLLRNKLPQVKFLIWGDGDELEYLRNYAVKEKIGNVFFKGRVDKKYIPFILCLSDLNLVHWEMSDVLRFGCSYNKLFEYLAAGKPIFSTVKTGYSLIEKYNCGIESTSFSSKDIAKEIIKILELPKEKLAIQGENAKKLSIKYDFAKLTEELINVLERGD